MIIALDDTEIRIATWLAKMRTDSNRRAGVVDQKIGSQDGGITDLEGMMGEMAFCKLYSCYPDLSIKPQHHTYDCLAFGYRIDVKTTPYKRGCLLAALTKAVSDCDYYALMIGEKGTYDYVGWAASSYLINEKNVGSKGHGKGYILEQSALGDPYRSPWVRFRHDET